jgi:hypothetical protein
MRIFAHFGRGDQLFVSDKMSRDSYGATEPLCVLNVDPKTRGIEYSGASGFRGDVQHTGPLRRSITVAAHSAAYPYETYQKQLIDS